MILLIHQHFPLAFFLLPQVFVDTSTLPILVELELDFVDTSTFSLAFFLLPQVFIDTSTLPILVELELDFVDTSTFSTGFLPVASGFC